jgi:4-hydroxythreonine-4-phosphate dehydrogenase
MAGPAHGTREMKPLIVTMGDPAGIGLDIILHAWQRRNELKSRPFAVLADPAALQERATLLGEDVSITELADLASTAQAFPTSLPVSPINLSEKATPGQPTSNNAAAVIAAIDRGVEAVAMGQAAAVVTCPIAKSVLYDAGFAHPGHTEYLGELSRRHWPDKTSDPIMMLAAEELRVVPLTVHIPLAAVPAEISEVRILAAARILSRALTDYFAIDTPRIAVAGLNPHAGEAGSIGREDLDIITPAIAQLKADGIDAAGPLSADTLFHAEARATYDAVLAMYHDQALIPIKTLAFDRGVNVTLGLPFIRTSPDHGTAFDIAGTGRANPTSFVEAMKLADRMARIADA